MNILECQVGVLVSVYHNTHFNGIRLHDIGEIIRIEDDYIKIVKYDKHKRRTNRYVEIKKGDIHSLKRT